MQPHGFTLLELMITVAILAILLAIGIPSFQSAIASSQLTNQTNRIVGALQQARIEAIKRNAHVVMCVSDDEETCDSTKSWASGWLIFQDANKNGAQDGGETILAVGQASPSSTTSVGNTNLKSSIRYGADGQLVGVANGTIRVCKLTRAVQDNARDIVLNRVGRVATERKDLNGACPAP